VLFDLLAPVEHSAVGVRAREAASPLSNSAGRRRMAFRPDGPAEWRRRRPSVSELLGRYRI